MSSLSASGTEPPEFDRLISKGHLTGFYRDVLLNSKIEAGYLVDGCPWRLSDRNGPASPLCHSAGSRRTVAALLTQVHTPPQVHRRRIWRGRLPNA